MANVIYRSEIFAEGDIFVGLCPELDVSSFDDTPEGALSNDFATFLEGCEYLGTLDEVESAVILGNCATDHKEVALLP